MTSKVIFLSSFFCFAAAAAFLPAAGCADSQGGFGDDPSTRLGSVRQALDGGDDGEAGPSDAGPGVAPKRGEVVISAVYGGGGGTGAAFRTDFVEIFNRSRNTISLDGTSLQYAPGGGDFGGAGNTMALSGTLPSGGYYLIALAGNGSEGANLPTPDLIGTLILGLNDGKVALAATTASLGCGAVSLCGTKPLDMVGYGATTDWEGSGATGGSKVAALDAMKAAVRKGGGCTDTDNNGADFTVGAPTAPKNSATAPAPCPLPPRPDASTPTPPPPVVDPPLGNEDPFDAGQRRDAGVTRPSGSAEDDCSVSAPGHSTSSSHDLAALGALAALTVILSARRRRS